MGKSFAFPPLAQELIFVSPPPSPPPPLSSSNLQSPSFTLDSKISPSILLIIIILAIIFFISGLLHLLVRFLLRPNQREPDELDNVTALQGQLQQLFHLHDAGVDQSYIDTLPVFHYKAIIGLKDPFDCAVCLCEFEPDDKLRLLPKCSHAFHMDCIDTWLLSHSTCPLCRSSLLSDFTANSHGLSPFVCVLESGSAESSREIGFSGLDRGRDSVSGPNPHLGIPGDGEFGSGRVEVGSSEEKIVTVKLGKFKSTVDGGEGSSENNDQNNNSSNNNSSSFNNNLGSRRCYSMGSFAYVMDEKTSLQVPVRTLMKNQKSKKKGSLKPGHRAAMSEYYGCDSRREFNGIEAFKSLDIHGNGRSNRESFSISKIWLRNKNGCNNGNINFNSSRRTISEFEIDVSELGVDEETRSCFSVDSLANPTTSSSTCTSNRRTLLWLMGRDPNKTAHNHSSFSSIV